MLDLHKVMQIIEGGFITQDIKSAFDYDLVSSIMNPHFQDQVLQKKVEVKIVLIMNKFQSFLLLLRKEK